MGTYYLERSVLGYTMSKIKVDLQVWRSKFNLWKHGFSTLAAHLNYLGSFQVKKQKHFYLQNLWFEKCETLKIEDSHELPYIDHPD